ncbi:uncharacterized protein LOC119382164 [Rhipicephalus sanguineus]|uniref:uncharacterized protein LOC119382164 n=1 Tax=Rhipicephalus sanguineus TaxID=34632 RepID=UPI0018960C15|nr:uncharacterized protein LOC119382164 [Rhipicephalus sanguineus]
MKADVQFSWQKPQEDAFPELQRRLHSPPILGNFYESTDTEVHTNASGVGPGAMLIQKKHDLERVIAYASRSLSKAELDNSTRQKECLAVVWAITKFRWYLYGRPFEVDIDHHAPCWLANLRDPSGRLARWSLRLQEYDVTVVYKSGRRHTDADCLPRGPVNTFVPCDDDDDGAFLGPVSSDTFANDQRADPDLRGVLEYLEGKTDTPPKAFRRAISSLCLQILRLSHAVNRKTTAYHPQTNGLTGRLNKTLANMLTMYVDVGHETWDEVLPYVTFAYNSAPQETTQMTPFELVFARPASTMLDAMLPHIDDGSTNGDVADFLQRAQEARQLAGTRIKEQQHTDTRLYNLRRRDQLCAPGDRVMVWTPIRLRGLSEKLLRRYFGPYKIMRRLGPLVYEVVRDGVTKSQRRRSRPEVVHVTRLKKFFER